MYLNGASTSAEMAMSSNSTTMMPQIVPSGFSRHSLTTKSASPARRLGASTCCVYPYGHL